jgi:hypothetical protein
MPISMNSAERWTPISLADRELVSRELESIVSSHHFRTSKRYPAFLRYVVNAALDGRSEVLKERTIGVEVFGRDCGYDTSADPVVRLSAAEVRKKIAQYYHETGNGKLVRIELPLGSYAPEFVPKAENPVETQPYREEQEPQTDTRRPRTVSRNSRRALVFGVGAVLMFAVAATLSRRGFSSPKPTVRDEFWAPLAKSPGSVLIVVGSSDRSTKLAPASVEATFIDHMMGPYHNVSVATATALVNLAGLLRQQGVAYEIKEDKDTTLSDLHSRTVVLVGANNNAWTMRLVSPLRFRFTPDPKPQILDTTYPQNIDWGLDFFKPYSTVSTDYAIVARYHDPTTEGPVMVIAGLGPFGTEAASEFAVTPLYLDQIARQLPAGWENKNLEMVVKSEVIDGKAGPPILVSSTVW